MNIACMSARSAGPLVAHRACQKHVINAAGKAGAVVREQEQERGLVVLEENTALAACGSRRHVMRWTIFGVVSAVFRWFPAKIFFAGLRPAPRRGCRPGPRLGFVPQTPPDGNPSWTHIPVRF